MQTVESAPNSASKAERREQLVNWLGLLLAKDWLRQQSRPEIIPIPIDTAPRSIDGEFVHQLQPAPNSTEGIP